jgi:hypothetical protein
MRLKLNAAHQLLVSVLMAGNINTTKRKIESVLSSGKEAGREVNSEQTKHTQMPRRQDGSQNHNIKIANRSFENLAKFKYFGTKLTNQNCAQEEIKCTLNSANACYLQFRPIIFSTTWKRID